MEKIYSIVYQTKPGAQTEFEFEYIDEFLFSKINKTNFFDENKLSLIKDNSVIIYSFDGRFLPKRFVEYFKKNKDYILFHCSNEGLNHSTYYYPQSRAVLRSGGWDPNITRKNVFNVPLGIRSGFKNPNPEAIDFSKKDLAWSFFGAIKSDRIQMKQFIDQVTPNFNHTSSGWNSTDQKGEKEVAEYYKRSIFIPSPKGNIYFECTRTMDALEYGCIPVAIKFHGYDGYKYLYGDHPFIVEKNWELAAKKMKELMADPIALRKKQTEVWEWYQQFKEDLSNDVKKILDGDTKNIISKQFYYQRRSKYNILLRLTFFYVFTLKVYFNRFILSKYIPAANR